MPRGSYGSVRIEYAVAREKVERSLTHYLRRVRSKVQLHKAILFGSYAKNNYSHGSDVDIAIIADGLPQDHGERYAALKESILGLDLQPFVYTTEEWIKMVNAGSGFAREILKHGKILYPTHAQSSGRRRKS